MLGQFILLFLVWIALSNSLHVQELLTGALVALSITLFIRPKPLPWLRIVGTYVRFIPTFLVALVRANIDVARIVLSPRISIRPGIVKLHTTLKHDHDKLLLANAITLTPGTLTLKLHDDTLFVHVLDLSSHQTDTLQDVIIEPFEKLLRSA
ncbi:MAG: Na+/H+ antiporter subunit E [Campylobacterales bacterium]|nr:Na+/H+ antiporter subunit E [Campylobacterales bacterium]